MSELLDVLSKYGKYEKFRKILETYCTKELYAKLNNPCIINTLDSQYTPEYMKRMIDILCTYEKIWSCDGVYEYICCHFNVIAYDLNNIDLIVKQIFSNYTDVKSIKFIMKMYPFALKPLLEHIIEFPENTNKFKYIYDTKSYIFNNEKLFNLLLKIMGNVEWDLITIYIFPMFDAIKNDNDADDDYSDSDSDADADDSDDEPLVNKRPPSLYNIFMRTHMNEFKKNHPGVDHKLTFAYVADLWAKAAENPKNL
jgi:hypothetical protein